MRGSQRSPADAGAQPDRRRERVERNIYRRFDAHGGERWEIGFRDSDGRQRWRCVEGGITAARVELARVKARMADGERVAPTRD